MCGIIGYTGSQDAKNIILGGLHKLEYRGYDSAGMTLFGRNGNLITVKTAGRVDELENKATMMYIDNSTAGIGHTRWATHGKPSDINAHPHGTDKVMLVHNGIIENFDELSAILLDNGYNFKSDTDTERAALTVDMMNRKFENHVAAIREAVSLIKGSYAFAIVFRDEPGNVYAVKKDSPLLVGIGKNENFIASDISAFLKYTSEYLRPADGEIVKLTANDAEIYGENGSIITKKTETAMWNSAAVEKSGFRHFMLKEIFEEPEVMKATAYSLLKDSLPDFTESNTDGKFFDNIGTIHIVACGTAMHAGLIGKYYIEQIARKNAVVKIASEFRYSNPILNSNDLVLIISQSGETADSLAALRLVKKMHIKTLAVVNTYLSTIAREADAVIYTKAGPEIAVASTKAFSVQSEVMLFFAVRTALSDHIITETTAGNIISSFSRMCAKSLHNVLCSTDVIEKAAEKISQHNDVFFIGRGYDSYLAMEASLKLKEISYIHSEAYPAGELKHGTISLITEGTPVIAIATDSVFYEKMRSNIEEVKSRGAYVISVCTEDAQQIIKASDEVLTIPSDETNSRPFTAAAVIQLLAYYTALKLKRDIDKPRNLAKSVTVE